MNKDWLLLKGDFMNSLIIDCSAGMKVYLCAGENVISKIDENQKKHTDELLLCVDELLKQAGLTVKDLDVVGMCEGPGSFTGIRVAISICKGLSVESKVKVVVASNFDIIQHGITGDAVFVLDGFSEFVYVRKFVGGMTFDECVNINDFAKEYFDELKNIDVYAQNDVVKQKLELLKIESKIAKNNTILCFKYKIENNLFININEINPIYLRASQAEIERNKKLNQTTGK